MAFMNAALGLRFVAAFLAVLGAAAFLALLFFAADLPAPALVFLAVDFLAADFFPADFFVAFLAVAMVLLPVNGRATCTTPNPLKQTLLSRVPPAPSRGTIPHSHGEERLFIGEFS